MYVLYLHDSSRTIYSINPLQARYRQYFEDDPEHHGLGVGDDAMIPMETQVLMQEVLTDGMAFCSLM